MSPLVMATTPGNEYKSRLYWQCRRGMLELDDMLQGFFRQSFDSLSPQQLKSFEALLKSPDDLLLEYLMGRTIPVDADIADVVGKIRKSIVSDVTNSA